jgi:CheY-like chemotaxis protein
VPTSGRTTALVVYTAADVLDLLTRWFEAGNFDVLAAVSAFRAQTHLEGDRPIDVVVAPWDATNPTGGDLYQWVLEHRPALRNRFVFIADEVPPEFDAVVRGRCLAVPLARNDELVRVATAIVRRVRTPPTGLPTFRVRPRPTLLLVEDDPLLLDAMAQVLADSGYAVTPTESGNQATEVLELRDFDVIVADWQMNDGSGADVYRWLVQHKPQLATRVVFLAEHDHDDARRVAPGRPMFRKGQDSEALIKVLSEIAGPRD